MTNIIQTYLNKMTDADLATNNQEARNQRKTLTLEYMDKLAKSARRLERIQKYEL